MTGAGTVAVILPTMLLMVTAALKNRNSTMMAFSPADCGDGCPGVSEPLCAGDPVTPPLTFGSPCQLKQYNCRKKRSLEVIQQGPCDEYIEEPRPSRKGIGRPPTPLAQDLRNKLVLTSRGDTAKPGGPYQKTTVDLSESSDHPTSFFPSILTMFYNLLPSF